MVGQIKGVTKMIIWLSIGVVLSIIIGMVLGKVVGNVGRIQEAQPRIGLALWGLIGLTAFLFFSYHQFPFKINSFLPYERFKW